MNPHNLHSLALGAFLKEHSAVLVTGALFLYGLLWFLSGMAKRNSWRIPYLHRVLMGWFDFGKRQYYGYDTEGKSDDPIISTLVLVGLFMMAIGGSALIVVLS